MKHWFSDLYASIDAMRLDEFTAGLAPDVKVAEVARRSEITPQHLFPWRKVGAGVGALERGSQAHRPTGSCGTQRIRDG